jgi:hypothetical protein
MRFPHAETWDFNKDASVLPLSNDPRRDFFPHTLSTMLGTRQSRRGPASQFPSPTLERTCTYTAKLATYSRSETLYLFDATISSATVHSKYHSKSAPFVVEHIPCQVPLSVHTVVHITYHNICALTKQGFDIALNSIVLSQSSILPTLRCSKKVLV